MNLKKLKNMSELTKFESAHAPLYPDLSKLKMDENDYKNFATRGYSPSEWDLPKSIMKSGWELQQIKAFTEWCNFHLKKSGIEIIKMNEDFKDARKLVALLESLTGEKIAIQNYGSTRFHKISNMNIAISFIESKGINLTSIGAEEIVDGNLKMTLGLIWMLILNFSLKQIIIQDSTAEKALLEWFQQRTKTYHKLEIENFSTSFRDGLAFCAIIHSYAPSLIDYTLLSKESSIKNLNLAFTLVEKYFGVPRMLDAGTVANNNLDKKAIITYISSLFHALTNYEMNDTNLEPSEFFIGTEPDEEFNRYLDCLTDSETTKSPDMIGYELEKSKSRSNESFNVNYSLVESKVKSANTVDKTNHQNKNSKEFIKVKHIERKNEKREFKTDNIEAHKPINNKYQQETSDSESEMTEKIESSNTYQKQTYDASESELDDSYPSEKNQSDESSGNETKVSSGSDDGSSDTDGSNTDTNLSEDTKISKVCVKDQNKNESDENSSDSIKNMIYEGINKQIEQFRKKSLESQTSFSDSDEESIITTVESEDELTNITNDSVDNNFKDNVELDRIKRASNVDKKSIENQQIDNRTNLEMLKIRRAQKESESQTENESVDVPTNVELLKLQKVHKELDSDESSAYDFRSDGTLGEKDRADSEINMSRNYEERYYVKDEREATSDYDDYRRSTSRARSTSRHNSRHRQPQNEDQYYRHKLQGGGGSGSSMSSMSDYEGRERPLVRCPRDVIRAPTPPPVIQRVVERAPTPEADIVERVIVRPQPQQLIERIIERPRTPPPKIIDKEICEPAPPPIVRTRIVKVDHSPRHYYSNQTQTRSQYAPPTTSRYDPGYDGYENQYSYSTTEAYPSGAQGYQSQAAAAYPTNYQGQAAASAYQSQPPPQAQQQQQQYYSQGGSSPYGYQYGYQGQGQAPSRQQGFDPRSSQYNQRY